MRKANVNKVVGQSKFLNKRRILTGIQKAIEEVAEAKKSGKKLQTLKDFLN